MARHSKSRKSKQSAAKKPKATKTRSASSQKPLIQKQPVSVRQAAVSGGLFLYTNDSWSQRYFDPKDLHNEEREIFG